MRQIVLDTETTGLETSQDHRIIEIGCVELIDRRITDRHWHFYLNPERQIEAGAFAVHGISNEFLQHKPLFAEVAQDFINYIKDAELIIHNAAFDVGFLDHEFAKLDGENTRISSICSVLDTLVMARQKHPGQKNNLDALCRRYCIDNSQRSLHGALLDARMLGDVYLAMTGGQTALSLDDNDNHDEYASETNIRAINRTGSLPIWKGSPESDLAHTDYIAFLAEQSDEPAWK